MKSLRLVLFFSGSTQVQWNIIVNIIFLRIPLLLQKNREHNLSDLFLSCFTFLLTFLCHLFFINQGKKRSYSYFSLGILSSYVVTSFTPECYQLHRTTKKVATYVYNLQKYHRIIELFKMLETLEGHLLQLPCSEQGHLQLHQVAQRAWPSLIA